jgi:hypothetical protein
MTDGALKGRAAFEADALKIALAHIAAMVEYALSYEPPDFLKAKRLCEVAEQLRRAVGTKVEDFAGTEGAFVCGEGDMEAGLVGRPRIGRGRIGGVDELTRMLFGLADQYLGHDMARKAAEARAAEAHELATLLELEESLDKMRHGPLGLEPVSVELAAVKGRIQVLAKNMEVAKEEIDGLVHPDVLGGHQADGQGQEDSRAADGDDGRGAGGAAPGAPQGEPVA